MTMGDRIVVMKDGFIQQIDTPIRLYHHPVNLFVAGFMGSPAMNFIDGRIVRRDGLHFISTANPDFHLDLAHHPNQDDLSAYCDQPIILGIRPEDLFDYEQVERFPHHSAPIEAEIDVIEPMGHEIFLYLNFNLEHALMCRINPREIPSVGNSIRIGFNTGKLHFFNSDTLQRIPD